MALLHLHRGLCYGGALEEREGRALKGKEGVSQQWQNWRFVTSE